MTAEIWLSQQDLQKKNVLLIDCSLLSGQLQVDVTLRRNSPISHDCLNFTSTLPPLQNNLAHRQIISNSSTLNLSPSISRGKETRGDILLHIASIKGDIPSVEDFFYNGTNSTVKNHYGWAMLHEVCSPGDQKVVNGYFIMLEEHYLLLNDSAL